MKRNANFFKPKDMIKFNPFQDRGREKIDFVFVRLFVRHPFCISSFRFFFQRNFFSCASVVGWLCGFTLHNCKRNEQQHKQKQPHNRIVLFIRFHYILHRIMCESMNGNMKETTAINRAQHSVQNERERAVYAAAKIGIHSN